MLPFLFPSSEVSAKVNWDLYEKYYSKDEYQDVKAVFFYPTPMSHLFTNVRHIKTMEDFEGLKLCAGQIIETNTLETLGAACVVIPRTEIFTGLERGLAEGNVANWEQSFIFKDFEVTDELWEEAFGIIAPGKYKVHFHLEVAEVLDLQEILNGTKAQKMVLEATPIDLVIKK